MTDPTNNALVARIKELEEALVYAIEYIDEGIDEWYMIDKKDAVRKLQEALNK